MIDALTLLNEEQVSSAIRENLYELRSKSDKKRRIALYAEREYAESTAFDVKLIADADGRLRHRAVGIVGRPAVKPKRGSTRVGSEGMIAHVVSQACESWPKLFMNHPGPDRIRGKTQPAGSIAIVTDFIGSGARIRDMLDAFWRVPSVRSWASRKWINFIVIAAAATTAGLENVERHRCRPRVLFSHAVPTVSSHSDWRRASAWRKLIGQYGPNIGRGTGRFGFGGNSALIAFSYRIPNNTPALIHHSDSAWNALYNGAIPPDLRPAFGMRSVEHVIAQAAANNGVVISEGMPAKDASVILILSLLKGRWRPGTEVSLSERTGLSVPDVWDILRGALKDGLIDRRGRLSNAGQALLGAGRRQQRIRPLAHTNELPYIPQALRTPREIV